MFEGLGVCQLTWTDEGIEALCAEGEDLLASLDAPERDRLLDAVKRSWEPGQPPMRLGGRVVDVRSDGVRRAFVVDVTEAHELRERYQMVLEGTRLGVWDWNPQTDEVVYDARWAEMLGYDLAALQRSSEGWQSRVHPDDLASCCAALKAHLEGRTPFYDHVHRMRRWDGRWVWVLDRGRIVEWDALERPIRVMGTHTDISAQKEAELAAHDAVEARSRFLATMSHEIRTPLNGLLGIVQLLERTDLDDEQRGFVDTLARSGENLLALVGDILDLTKLEVGKLQLDPRPFSPVRLAREVVDLYAETAQRKGLTLAMSVDDVAAFDLQGDEHRLKQVLSNLVSNAVKFTERGWVIVRVEVREGSGADFELVFEVEDSGPGIAEPERVFEAFRQGDDGIARRHGGTGLGLTICRELVSLFDGTLDVRSAVGRGTTFQITLHLPEAEQPSLHDEPTADPVPPAHVLVVEDNKVNQMVIRGMLERLGCSVVLADDGFQALDRLDEGPFDLVLMDIHLPGMHGIETTRRLIEALGAAMPPVVALSADVLADNRAQCARVGMRDFLSKPVRIEEVARTLRRFVRPRAAWTAC